MLLRCVLQLLALAHYSYLLCLLIQTLHQLCTHLLIDSLISTLSPTIIITDTTLNTLDCIPGDLNVTMKSFFNPDLR